MSSAGHDASGGHGGHGGKAIVAAFFANLGIAFAKFVGFIITGSSSMLAEGVHSLADTGNQGLLLLGGRRAKRAPTQTHQFGYSRERYFWAFVVALVLFIGGAVFALYEGVAKVRHPHELDSPLVAIVILVVAVGLEGFSFRTAVTESNPLRKGRPWLRFIRDSKAPELPVLLLEDFGALVGLLLALGGVLATMATDNAIFDGIATLAIGALLAVIAVTLAVEMKSLLIGESATDEEMAEIEAALVGSPDVVSLIHLRTQHLGPDDLLVAAKVHFANDLTMAQLADAIDRAEVRVRERFGSARMLFIEPDLRRGA